MTVVVAVMLTAPVLLNAEEPAPAITGASGSTFTVTTAEPDSELMSVACTLIVSVRCISVVVLNMIDSNTVW